MGADLRAIGLSRVFLDGEEVLLDCVADLKSKYHPSVWVNPLWDDPVFFQLVFETPPYVSLEQRDYHVTAITRLRNQARDHLEADFDFGVIPIRHISDYGLASGKFVSNFALPKVRYEVRLIKYWWQDLPPDALEAIQSAFN